MSPGLRYVAGNAIAVLIGLTAAYVALLFSGGGVHVIDIRTVDLLEYMSVGRLIREGHGGLIYNWQAMYAAQVATVGRTAALTTATLPFLYPPIWACFFVPLSALPYTAAYLVWIAFNGLLLMAVMYELERYTLLSGRRAIAFRWLALTFLPVFLALVLGQVSVLILAAVTAAFVALRLGNGVPAGCVLALGCLKPTYLAPVLLVLLVRRCWRALGGFVATMVVLILAPLPILGLSVYASYIQMVRQVSAWQGRSVDKPLWFHSVPISSATYAPQWNHSLAGLTQLMLQGRASPALLYTPAVLAALLLVAWGAYRAPSLDLPYALAVVAGLIIGPHTLMYDYTLLLLPVAVALRYRAHNPRILTVVLVAGYLLVVTGAWLAFAIQVQTTVLAGILLTLWLAWLCYRSSAQSLTPEGVEEGEREGEAPTVGPILST